MFYAFQGNYLFLNIFLAILVSSFDRARDEELHGHEVSDADDSEGRAMQAELRKYGLAIVVYREARRGLGVLYDSWKARAARSQRVVLPAGAAPQNGILRSTSLQEEAVCAVASHPSEDLAAQEAPPSVESETLPAGPTQKREFVRLPSIQEDAVHTVAHSDVSRNVRLSAPSPAPQTHLKQAAQVNKGSTPPGRVHLAHLFSPPLAQNAPGSGFEQDEGSDVRTTRLESPMHVGDRPRPGLTLDALPHTVPEREQTASAGLATVSAGALALRGDPRSTASVNIVVGRSLILPPLPSLQSLPAVPAFVSVLMRTLNVDQSGVVAHIHAFVPDNAVERRKKLMRLADEAEMAASRRVPRPGGPLSPAATVLAPADPSTGLQITVTRYGQVIIKRVAAMGSARVKPRETDNAALIDHIKRGLRRPSVSERDRNNILRTKSLQAFERPWWQLWRRGVSCVGCKSDLFLLAHTTTFPATGCHFAQCWPLGSSPLAAFARLNGQLSGSRCSHSGIRQGDVR